MNIEGVTLLNQFIEYSYSPFIIIPIIIIGVIIGLIGSIMMENDNPIGILVYVFALIFTIITCIIIKENIKYPAYTHYIIQINDRAAWSEIAPNYIIVEEVYPNTGIYEIKREYKEGDEQ